MAASLSSSISKPSPGPTNTKSLNGDHFIVPRRLLWLGIGLMETLLRKVSTERYVNIAIATHLERITEVVFSKRCEFLYEQIRNAGAERE
eukprot:SAG31_NODE_803_length_12003_cov_25.248593_6_plen_90_part_00